MGALAATLLALLVPMPASAAVTMFFHSNQVATLVATGTTWDTISCEGYQFTYTRDKLFTGGIGMTNPIGRTVRVPWPQGVEAQAVTVGPTMGGARMTVARVDGGVFALPAITFKLLANTAGAGATLEIMPMRNGEDLLNDPVFFQASGYYGSSFSYTTSTPAYLGTTAALTNGDAYKIGLYVDFALTALTLETSTPASNHAPTDLQLSNTAVLENEPAGTWIGTLDTVDPDAGDSFTYTLVAGAGSADNNLFQIVGSDLYTAASFNYETRSNCSIRVETEDQGLLATQKVFTIGILDVDEPPPAFDHTSGPAAGGMVLRWYGLPNHRYAVHVSTNLLEGFTVAQSNLPADLVQNCYTDDAPSSAQRFWKITTEP